MVLVCENDDVMEKKRNVINFYHISIPGKPAMKRKRSEEIEESEEVRCVVFVD